MDEVGDLSLSPEVVQAQIALQAVGDPQIQLGDGEYLGQDGMIGQAGYLNMTLPEQGVTVDLSPEEDAGE